MKKTYAYKKKKQNSKIIIFPLMLLIVIGIVVGISTLTKKKTKAETNGEWVCNHNNSLYFASASRINDSNHTIHIGCSKCKNTNIIEFNSDCAKSKIRENNTVKCALCGNGFSDSPTGYLCSHPKEKYKIIIDGKNGRGAYSIRIECTNCRTSDVSQDSTKGIIAVKSSISCEHKYMIPSTCSEYGECLLCGYKDKQYDKSKHFTDFKCSEAISNSKYHGTMETCSNCNSEVRSTVENHTNMDKWTITSLYHMKKCSKCEYIEEEEIHVYDAPTCTNPLTCKTCGYSYPNSSRNPNAHVDNDNNGICDLCGKTIQSAESTCTHPSSRVDPATCKKGKYCNECKRTISNPIDHNYSEATCTKAATCSMCGTTKGQPNGHQYDTTKGEKYGFSTTNGGSGMHWKVCKVCGIKDLTNCVKSKTESIEKPTCTKKGKWKYTCNICEAYWYATIPAMGHKFDSEGKCTRTGCTATKDGDCAHGIYTDHWDYKDKTTCTRTRTCKDCGEEISVEDKEHTGGTHARNGVCTQCNQVYLDHKRTTGVPLNPEWEITENSHRQRLECYGCKEIGESGNCILRRRNGTFWCKP